MMPPNQQASTSHLAMKPSLKSLADTPARALSLAAAMPGRAAHVSKQVLAPTVRASRRGLHAARRRSSVFARDLYARAGALFPSITPWQRGGLNE